MVTAIKRACRLFKFTILRMIVDFLIQLIDRSSEKADLLTAKSRYGCQLLRNIEFGIEWFDIQLSLYGSDLERSRLRLGF